MVAKKTVAITVPSLCGGSLKTIFYYYFGPAVTSCLHWELLFYRQDVGCSNSMALHQPCLNHEGLYLLLYLFFVPV